MPGCRKLCASDLSSSTRHRTAGAPKFKRSLAGIRGKQTTGLDSGSAPIVA